MKFHVPSFLIGCAVGAAAVVALPRLKPVLVEIGASACKLYDVAMARLAMAREDVEDLLAEAKARARPPKAATQPPTASA